MRSWKYIVFVLFALLTIASLLLAACGPIDTSGGSPDNGNGKDKNKDKDKDKEKGNDNDADDDANEAKADKVIICHRTGSAKNPYVMIRIAEDAAKDGHAAHEGDLIPAPEGGCPDMAPATSVPIQ